MGNFLTEGQSAACWSLSVRQWVNLYIVTLEVVQQDVHMKNTDEVLLPENILKPNPTNPLDLNISFQDIKE